MNTTILFSDLPDEMSVHIDEFIKHERKLRKYKMLMQELIECFEPENDEEAEVREAYESYGFNPTYPEDDFEVADYA